MYYGIIVESIHEEFGVGAAIGCPHIKSYDWIGLVVYERKG
jgi:hypothetical protein